MTFQIARILMIGLVCLSISEIHGRTTPHLRTEDSEIDQTSDGLDRHRQLFFKRKSKPTKHSKSERRFRDRLMIDIQNLPPRYISPQFNTGSATAERAGPTVSQVSTPETTSPRRGPPQRYMGRRKMAKNYYQYGYYWDYGCNDAENPNAIVSFNEINNDNFNANNVDEVNKFRYGITHVASDNNYQYGDFFFQSGERYKEVGKSRGKNGFKGKKAKSIKKCKRKFRSKF